MKRQKFFEGFLYNDSLFRWLWFVIETLVSAFVGALIAFVFGDYYEAALIAFGILMIFLITLSVIFIVFENKVSILSIMNQGLKDGKYEDVIKFGSAMRNTLFTSNKNDDIVMLGFKIDEAASKIESAHYNKSKGDYLVTVDGTPKSITQIRIGLKIDDLGWSMHLCRRNDEAVANIIDGMKRARNEALRLSRVTGNQDGKAITPFVKLILRGYRHLCGIYFEDVTQHWRAIFYENVTKLIMSNYRIISLEGLCVNQENAPVGTTCGLFCSSIYEKKVECSRNNILRLYFQSSLETNETSAFDAVKLYGFINSSRGGLMSIEEIETDISLFNMVPNKTKNEMAKEQCYAWGRNIVKKIQSGMHKQGEYDFISDIELTCLVAEARAFSQVYYYGVDPVGMNDDFDSVIKKDVVGKAELRYASLMNEIELVNLLLPSPQKQAREINSGRNTKIEKLINNLKATREMCRDKRADLYVRASTHLISAYYFEYNLNYRYMTNDIIDKSLESRKKTLQYYKKTIEQLYKEIVAYEHKVDNDLENKYYSVMEDLKNAKKKHKKTIIGSKHSKTDIFIGKFSNVDALEYEQHLKLDNIYSAVHSFSEEEIDRLKEKWEF